MIRALAHLPGRDWAFKCAIGSQNRFARFAVRASEIAECPKAEVLLYYFPREEIWTCNVHDKKWICRVAEGDEIPPPCEGAQCVVIDGIIYSYGGKLKKWGDGFEEVFGLNPNEMKWIRVATPVDGKKPWKRYEACYGQLENVRRRMRPYSSRSPIRIRIRVESE